MKKSVLTLIRNCSVLCTAFVVLSLCSCTGLLQKTGSVSFEISPELLNVARDGDQSSDNREFVRIVVALEGSGYGIKQTVDISMSDYETCLQTDKRFEATFDNIPVGKKLYAVIKSYTIMPGNNLPIEIRDPELYGKSDYFTVKAGQNKVEIKASSDYRSMVPYSYNDTPLVIYNKNSNEYEYNVGEHTFNASQNSFCFDCNGHFIALDRNVSNAYSIISDYLPCFELCYSNFLVSIVVDSKTNIMYSYYCNSSDVYIKKYPELISSMNAENPVEKTISLPGVKIGELNYGQVANICTIHDGIVYIISIVSGNGSYLTTASFEDGSIITEAKKIEIPDGDKTDIIYLDGSLYLLINNRENGFSNSCTMSPYGYYSRGALVKYNLSDGSIKTLGWTPNPLNNSGKYLYIQGGSGINDKTLYEDSACTIPFKICADNLEGIKIGGQQILFPSFFVPAGLNNTNQFYGPQKIIGIKPKKLIIADDGVAFYTDADNAYNVKNVNRIVTVDLESFAITSVVNTDLIFDSEQSVTITTSAYGDVAALMETGKTYYLSDDVDFIPTSEHAELYAYIPLEDN